MGENIVMTIDSALIKDSLSILGLATSKSETTRPLSQLIELVTIDGVLYGFTSTGLHMIKKKIAETDEDMDCLVNFDMFSNVIKTCEGMIELKPTDKSLGVKSSTMKCKLPLYSIQSGEGMPHPDDATGAEIDFSNIADVIPAYKSCIKHNIVQNSVLDNIYFGESGIMTTDNMNLVLLDRTYFDEPLLLPIGTVEVLNKIGKGKCTIEQKGKEKRIVVTNDDFTYSGAVIVKDMSEFEYKVFVGVINTELSDKVTIKRAELVNAINASQMFITFPTLIFSEKGVFLKIESMDFIYKISSEACANFTYSVSPELLKRILFIKDEDLTIEYGNDSDGSATMLKIVGDNGITELISVEEDNK